jgi:hypothetical protein
MMSTQNLEAAGDESDDQTRRARELEAYHIAVKHLDPEEVLCSACAVLPFQQSSALLDLVQEQMTYPVEDISRVYIHPDKAQRIARAFLEAVAVSIDGMSSVRYDTVYP